MSPAPEPEPVAARPAAQPQPPYAPPAASYATPPAHAYGPAYVPAYSPAPLTSKNGPAKASLILILIQVLGLGVIPVLLSGLDPMVMTLVSLVNVAMVIAAFVLAIVALRIAIRRPTKKRESIFALVVSSLMLVFLAVRLVIAFNTFTIDDALVENAIAEWAAQETGESFDVTCPPVPNVAAGDTFTCSATGNAGTQWQVEVTVGADGTATWMVVA
ncbi:DUF4333 domain-containing protein [Microbacterium sp. PA5]|uniref:DUF4333 domain-containing protein n=1 Tax=Microbacterium sp. PA5 TaxID=3416654 RepID=UPI003CF9AC12